MPARMPLSVCAAHQLAVLGHDPGVGRGALGHPALAVDQPGLVGAALARRLLGEHVGQERDGLDVAASPADVGLALDRDAGPRIGLGALAVLGRQHQRRFDRRRREGVVAPRHAARHLHIDQPVAQPVAAHQLADDEAERRRATPARRSAARRASGRDGRCAASRRSACRRARRRPRRRRRRAGSRDPRYGRWPRDARHSVH